MTSLTFYPLNNADTTLIQLKNGKLILVDYAHCKLGEEDCEAVIDLKAALLVTLKKLGKTEIDTVLFTHADKDHIRNASEFFWFEHATKYQDKDRIKIKELWVPAGLVLEVGLTEEAGIIRQEARHRLKEGKGIRVFSWPEALHEWMDENELSFDSLKSLITDAGSIVPGYDIHNDGIELFAHSPFAHRDGDELQSRNDGSVVLHATFDVNGNKTKVFLGADCEHEVLGEIVRITKYKKRFDRLEWDVLKLPHHCSYGTLSSEKGENETVPDEDVDYLYQQGNRGCIIVSPSKPIPKTDEDQPPHRQAANYYKRIAREKDGEFVVTMEYPSTSAPKELKIIIDNLGASIDRKKVSAAPAVAAAAAPRAGAHF